MGRPHGLAGAFVVERASDAPERFAVGSSLLAGGEPATVVESKRAGGRTVIRLDRRVDRGTSLEVPREELPQPAAPDTYYVFELVGLTVEQEGGRALGTVSEVLERPANDVLELDSGVLLPLVEDCVLEVDLERGRIVVAPGFADPESSGRACATRSTGSPRACHIRARRDRLGRHARRRDRHRARPQGLGREPVPYSLVVDGADAALRALAGRQGCEASTSDRVLANRFIFHLRQPERGEIVVFKVPPKAATQCNVAAGDTFVKRLMGVPGDTILSATAA